MTISSHRLISLLAAAAMPALVLAQPATIATTPQGITRTDLVRQDLGVPGHEVIQVRVDFRPGAYAPDHTHPGEEVAYVLAGTLEYQVEDRPPVTLRTGETLFIPAGAVHSARNVGDDEASELATYIVRKGEALLTQVK